MEYHSFLQEAMASDLGEILLSFRLLMEYHSFLLKNIAQLIKHTLMKFPSPYGVSFILT